MPINTVILQPAVAILVLFAITADGMPDASANCGPASTPEVETRDAINLCLNHCCPQNNPNCTCWNTVLFGHPQIADVVVPVESDPFCKYINCMHSITEAKCAGHETMDGMKGYYLYLNQTQSKDPTKTLIDIGISSCPIPCPQNEWRRFKDDCVRKLPCLSDRNAMCTKECVDKYLDCGDIHCDARNDWTTDVCIFRYPKSIECKQYNLDESCAALLVKSNSGDDILLVAIVVPTVLGSLLCIAAIAIIIYIYRNKQMEKDQLQVVMQVNPEKDTAPILASLHSGGWTKGKILGRGQFGTVYLVLLPGGSALACKQLEVGGQQEEELQTYMREIVTMKDLNHPNIVRYFYACYNREEGNIQLFMEYVQGGSLARLVRTIDDHLSEAQAIRYMKQVLSGVAYLHEHGIVHRDLKGDNVLVDTSEGVCKISDFGSSKNIRNLENPTIAKTITGTPNWMAPEMITNAGETEHNEKVDVWSLGCTTVEILNKGKPPWPEFATHWAAIYHIANTDAIPDIPTNLSNECQNFILRCLKRDPKERPSVAELLTHPWLDLHEGGESANADFTKADHVDENIRQLIANHSTDTASRNKTSINTSVEQPASVKESLNTAATHPVRESLQTVESSNNEVVIEMKENPKPALSMDTQAVPSFSNSKLASSQPYGDNTGEDDEIDTVNYGTVPSAVVRNYDMAKQPPPS
eukprot:TRINITY_DN776_c9_g1_i1.p1 TRINITY_DN776_c9_g1~~TRINITY_DN776_c9_g1_i1.p1  ORF type:complete len:708 (+),score=92.37 TRINITY_DN776_c9_g1_i1:34-2124(+)